MPKTKKNSAKAEATAANVGYEAELGRRRLLHLLRDFIVFEDDGGKGLVKKAGYHQFHAAQTAMEDAI